MISAEDATRFALLYHLNSEPWLVGDGFSEAYRVDYRTVGDPAAALKLPAPRDSVLGQLIRNRCSCRQFGTQPMPLATFATLLWAANGITHESRLPDGALCINRTLPSAGALYPLELYALIRRVEGTADGLYHYGVQNHALETVREGATLEDSRSALLVYSSIENANLVLFISGVFNRTQRKYGPRGYRYVLLEAGHAAQNICLVATEQQLGSLCIGGYADCRVSQMLGVDPAEEGVLYAVAVGFPAA